MNKTGSASHLPVFTLALLGRGKGEGLTRRPIASSPDYSKSATRDTRSIPGNMFGLDQPRFVPRAVHHRARQLSATWDSRNRQYTNLSDVDAGI